MIAAFLIVATALSLQGDTGKIVGRVTDEAGNPILGATVLLLGTSYGAMTDPNGEYYIINLAPGTYDVQARRIDYGAVTREDCEIIAGLTTRVDLQLTDESAGGGFQAQYFEPDTSRVLYAAGIDDGALDELVVFSGEEYCPATRLSESSWRVLVPSAFDSLCYFLPWTGIRRVEPLEGDTPGELIAILDPGPSQRPTTAGDTLIEDFPLRIADLTDDEWVAEGFTLTRETIDPEQWGHPDRKHCGMIILAPFFDQTDEGEMWRIVMVFHERAVVLSEGADPIVHELPWPVLKARLSPGGRFLLAFECIGFFNMGGDAAMIDLETGDTIVFDPTPERERPDPYVIYLSVTGFNPLDNYYVGDSGSLVSIAGDSVRIFDKHMNLTRAFSTEQFDLGGVPHSIRRAFMNAGGTRFLVPDYVDEGNRLVIMDSGGYVRGSIEVEYCLPREADLELSLATVTGSMGYGVGVLSLRTGELLHLWHEADRFAVVRLSPRATCVALSTTIPDFQSNPLNEVRSVDDGSLLYGFPGYSVDWENAWVSAVSDSGVCLLDATSREAPWGDYWWRWALVDESGVIWLSAIRYCLRWSRMNASWPHRCAISESGRRVIYEDGFFLHVLTFEESG